MSRSSAQKLVESVLAGEIGKATIASPMNGKLIQPDPMRQAEHLSEVDDQLGADHESVANIRARSVEADCVGMDHVLPNRHEVDA